MVFKGEPESGRKKLYGKIYKMVGVTSVGAFGLLWSVIVGQEFWSLWERYQTCSALTMGRRQIPEDWVSGLLVIAEGIRQPWQDSWKPSRIDFDGAWTQREDEGVVIELKRGETGEHMDLSRP